MIPQFFIFNSKIGKKELQRVVNGGMTRDRRSSYNLISDSRQQLLLFFSAYQKPKYA